VDYPYRRHRPIPTIRPVADNLPQFRAKPDPGEPYLSQRNELLSELDMGAMRFLLALSVVLAHSGERGLVGGQVAVQLFYMISGFLISYILLNNRKYDDTKWFYINRFLRIFPAYYVVLLLAIPTFVLSEARVSTLVALPDAVRSLLILSNVTILGQDLVLFSKVSGDTIGFAVNFRDTSPQLWEFLLVPQAWSLGLELTFYLIAPFIIRSKRLICTLFAVSLTARGLAVYCGFGQNDPWTYRFFPFEIALFLLGAISHQFLFPWALQLMTTARGQFISIVVTLAMTSLCVAYPLLLRFPGHILLIFSFFALALPFLFLFQVRFRFDSIIGELSYPIYIVHWLVLESFDSLFHRLGRGHGIVFSSVVIITTIVFGAALNFAVTRPIEQIRRRIKASVGGPRLQPSEPRVSAVSLAAMEPNVARCTVQGETSFR
jgi:peptidoglycan/LPS O-acetylase OafA/YrhL